MKSPTLAVKTTLFEPVMLRTMIEKMADRRRDLGYSNQQAQPGWHSIEFSTVETQVSGIIQFSSQNRITNMPFVTGFMFTCIKRKKEDYRLTWACSLS